jgi:hypothetical protein
MYKATLLLALGFAVASAFERDLQGALASSGLNITTTCNRGTTETCTANAGYCCAAVTKAGAAANTNATLGVCVPAEFHTHSFNVSGTVWGFNCAVPATATTLATSIGSCNSTNPCSNTTTQCCATRSWTVAGVAGSKAAATSCIAKTNSGIQYWANWNVTTMGPLAATAQVSAVCPTEETTGGDGSFAAAIKVTAVMVLALVAGMFF